MQVYLFYKPISGMGHKYVHKIKDPKGKMMDKHVQMNVTVQKEW